MGVFIQPPATLTLNNGQYSWISKFCLSSKIKDLGFLVPFPFVCVSHAFIEHLLGSRDCAGD